jgi:hypothetical protein
MSNSSPRMATRLGTAVRIHLQPSYRKRLSLSNSRSILAALKKFGEVNTFKNLKVKKGQAHHRALAPKPTLEG